MKEKLTKTDMENYLLQINEKLTRDDKHGQTLLVGGTVIKIIFGTFEK